VLSRTVAAAQVGAVEKCLSIAASAAGLADAGDELEGADATCVQPASSVAVVIATAIAVQRQIGCLALFGQSNHLCVTPSRTLPSACVVISLLFLFSYIYGMAIARSQYWTPAAISSSMSSGWSPLGSGMVPVFA
jgi:hypothetical protein